MYILGTGCQWRAIPKDLPPRSTIHDYLDRWIHDGTPVTLAGNTRPEANAANDRDAVADDLPLDHMLLQLRRPPEQDAALGRMIDALHDAATAAKIAATARFL